MGGWGFLRLGRVDKVSRSLRGRERVVTLCLGHSLPSLKSLPGLPREVRPLQLWLSSDLAGPPLGWLRPLVGSANCTLLTPSLKPWKQKPIPCLVALVGPVNSPVYRMVGLEWPKI